jgi:hypothetical protein
MRTSRFVPCLLLSSSLGFAAEPHVLREWKFDKDSQGWTAVNSTPLVVQGGTLRFETTGGDAFIVSPLFDLVPAPGDLLEICLTSTTQGMGEWFWRESTEGPYGGFMPNLRRAVGIQASPSRQVLRTWPFWQGCKRIIGLRFDVPEGTPGRFEVASVRILRLTPGELGYLSRPWRGEFRLPAAAPRIDVATQAPPQTRLVPSDYTVAMWYFAAWEPEYTWDGWKQVAERSPWRMPLLYDSKDAQMSFNGIQFYLASNPRVLDWHVHWMREHAVNLMLWDWYSLVDKDGKFDPSFFGNRALEMGFLGKARLGGPPLKTNRFANSMPFAIMWTNHPPHQQVGAGLFDYIIRQFMAQPNYYTIDGRPLVAVWSVGQLVKEAGGIDQGRRLLEQFRQQARDSGCEGLFIAAVQEATPDLVRRLGFDGVMGYQYTGTGGTRVEPRQIGGRMVEDYLEDYPTQTVPGHVKTWTLLAQAYGPKYLVATTPMQNFEPTFRDGNPIIQNHTPDAYRQMLRNAKTLIEQRGLRRFISIEAWNEWLEGSYVEPSTQWGLSYLEAIRDIFARPGT